jgi:hypothetical protein
MQKRKLLLLPRKHIASPLQDLSGNGVQYDLGPYETNEGERPIY